jgi:hypothetical protein
MLIIKFKWPLASSTMFDAEYFANGEILHTYQMFIAVHP